MPTNHIEYSREYYKNNKVEFKRKYKEYNWEIRQQVIQFYSDSTMKCRNCDIDDIDVLTVDHINGDGIKHRKKIATKLYIWLCNNNFPSGFRILCRNCNWKENLRLRHDNGT